MMGVVLALLGVGVSTATGWFVVATLDPEARGPAHRVLQVCLAVVVGSFLHGVAYLVWSLLLRHAPGSYWSLDILPLVIALVVWMTVGRAGAAPAVVTAKTRPDWVLCGVGAAFGVTLILAALGAVYQSMAQPLGYWDAWMMWNYRARMLYLAPPHMMDLYAAPFMHPDYPMGLPLMIARVWRYMGSDPTWVPQGVGVICTILPGVLIASGVATVRGARVGLVMGTLLFGSLPFIRQGAWQYADHPMAMVMLAAAVAAVVWLHGAAPRPLRGVALVGLLLGAAAWTKNEGLTFACLLGVLVPVCAGVPERRRLLRIGLAGFIGFAPAAVMLVLHRSLSAEQTDLVSHAGAAEMWAKAWDPERYALIMSALRSEVGATVDGVVAGCVVLAAMIVWGRRFTGGAPALVAVGGVLAGQAAAYLLIYLLISPSLSWHLATSMDRLVLHLYPLGILFLGLCLPPWGCGAGGQPEKEARAQGTRASVDHAAEC